MTYIEGAVKRLAGCQGILILQSRERLTDFC
jgi:hypothetical protein